MTEFEKAIKMALTEAEKRLCEELEERYPWSPENALVRSSEHKITELQREAFARGAIYAAADQITQACIKAAIDQALKAFNIAGKSDHG